MGLTQSSGSPSKSGVMVKYLHKVYPPWVWQRMQERLKTLLRCWHSFPGCFHPCVPEKDKFYRTSQCFPSKVIIDAMQSITNYAIENDRTIISVGAGSGMLEEHARLQGAKICCIELDSDCENRYKLEDSETFFKGDVHRIQWLRQKVVRLWTWLC